MTSVAVTLVVLGMLVGAALTSCANKQADARPKCVTSVVGARA